MSTDKKVKHVSLHITISALFISLIVILGMVLSWQNYNKSSEIILSTANTLYEQITRELVLDFRGTYRPVGDTLALLALSDIIRADSLEQRLTFLDLFSETLGSEPAVAGIQVGYPNGDFFISRPLRSRETRDKFSAPDNATIIVDHVDTDTSGERQLTRLFFDRDLAEIARNPPAPTDYDPRVRPWYTQAKPGKQPVVTQPYLFYFLGKVGTTITRMSAQPGVVIASDVTLENLSETISQYRITPGSEVALIDARGKVLAYQDADRLLHKTGEGEFRAAHLAELGSEVLTFLARDLKPASQDLDFEFEGQAWQGAIRKVSRPGIIDIYVLIASPLNELLDDAIALRRYSVFTTLIIILLSIPVVWLVAARISGPMKRLATEARLIRHFDFHTPTETRSFISEVNQLSDAIAMMKQTISRFLALINSLAGENNFDSLLQRITRETSKISQADGVLTYLLNDAGDQLDPGTLYDSDKGNLAIDNLPVLPTGTGQPLADAASSKSFSVIRLDKEQSHEMAALLEELETENLTLFALPLRNRQGECIGVLCLLYRGNHSEFDAEEHQAQIAFVQALSGFAAVSLESRHLLMMQEALLDAFIKLIAGAIDAKSPYTGGHCQRVPELTRMLAQAACDSNEAPFEEFRLGKEEWEALDIASWLHDCGKVTTPEYVVDKATKLETIYDRIHEIRMRFEVLKRDAEIRCLEQAALGGDRAELEDILAQEHRQLDEEFAFVAECNLGGEFMAPERVEHLRQIAGKTWMRTLDDRIGISWEELQRREKKPASPLPATEKLIDNKVWHLIERSDADRMPDDNRWGFRLDVPEYKYNRGELYNLETGRGTLTHEERYKINDHMVQTIIMLEKLPYPKHLREVPAIAGGHHETMDGKGYPKRLHRDQMSLTARMMAIADIFEALTASDRPYKKAKTLSEAIRIMSFMRNDQHIDPDLFKLFLASGTWLEYGRKFLDPEQLDEVDVTSYLEQ
jgi:HD-GYP domain-containing protein (c-di-GMP phosphodiesterase class II)